ncbi:hypothetical protein HQN89_10905 [Paenibacillus frigoriresistens]|uniref:hypothetical protein n=1 Tax=Paenibacillus alginolyticus TaxID=59839 RepID=UPI00156370F9|nr:hypothetical protein [Paenibacillus frigoriresistens]NRF91528.1 hypothetical protein [Paenibacillus frigoriresistens]
MDSLRAAAGVGINITEYNEMTPYELSVYIQEYNKYEVFMQKERISAAYMGAYFERVKNWPKLEDVFKKDKQPEDKKEQSDADMLAEVKRLNAMFGGTVV